MSMRGRKSLSEVLDQISKSWVPGISRFFEKHDPDPLATLNEQLEIGIIGVDPSDPSYQLALESYEYSMLELLRCYKRIREISMGDYKPELDNRDAFWMGAHDGETRIDAFFDQQSREKYEPIRKFF